METIYFAEMSSRGRQSTEELQANCILMKRFLSAEGYSVERLEGQITKYLGPYMKGKGPPARRTVQDWVKLTPDFPETALRDRIIVEEDILPWLKPYLRREEFHVDLRQEISSIPQADSGLSQGQAVAVVAVGAYLFTQLFKKRPPRQRMRLTGRRAPRAWICHRRRQRPPRATCPGWSSAYADRLGGPSPGGVRLPCHDLRRQTWAFGTPHRDGQPRPEVASSTQALPETH